MELLFLIGCLITLLLFVVGGIGCIADPYTEKKWPDRVMGAASVALSVAITVLLIKVIVEYLSA